MTELSTKRLELLPLSASDAEALHAQWNDADVGRFLWDGQPVARGTVAAVIERSDADFLAHGYGLWGLRLTGEAALIGFCGFREVEAIGEVEILYALLPAFWDQGLATEAAAACVAHAFGALGLSRVLAGADPPNLRSVRVMQRLGMQAWRRVILDGRPTDYFALARP